METVEVVWGRLRRAVAQLRRNGPGSPCPAPEGRRPGWAAGRGGTGSSRPCPALEPLVPQSPFLSVVRGKGVVLPADGDGRSSLWGSYAAQLPGSVDGGSVSSRPCPAQEPLVPRAPFLRYTPAFSPAGCSFRAPSKRSTGGWRSNYAGVLWRIRKEEIVAVLDIIAYSLWSTYSLLYPWWPAPCR